MTAHNEAEPEQGTGGQSAAGAATRRHADPGTVAAPSEAWYAAVNAAIGRQSARSAEVAPSSQEGWKSRAVDGAIEYTAPDGSLHSLPFPDDISRAVVSEVDIYDFSDEIDDARWRVRKAWEQTEAATEHWNQREAGLLRLMEPLAEGGWDFHTRRLSDPLPAIKFVAHRIEEAHIDEAPDYIITVNPRRPDAIASVASYVNLLATYTPETSDRLIAALRGL